MEVKHIIKLLCPPLFIIFFHKVKAVLDDMRRRNMTAKEIFTEIYDNKLWGSSPVKFYSGPGSEEESVVRPYVQKISDFLKASMPKKPRIVDLGCGNFEVGKHFLGYCSEYIGVDVVPNLIEELNATKASSSVKFLCLDIINDELPDGDIAFLRQVLQHLSNEQILKILPKLRKYKIVFVTEHYPATNLGVIPNKNIVPGSAIRATRSLSGVYLEKAPFNIPKDALELFLEVPGTGTGRGSELGVIRTYKLELPANDR